ncbi:hypothetical protein HGM15179_020239, partial [Zosterops borbonicus]
QRMRRRCTPWADTECSPCQDGYFSPRPHHGFCQSCTVCHTWTGSVEVKACDKTSDTVCVCRPGFQPEGSPAGSECSPCPEGTFSRGGNANCRPWTNCSSFGKSILRAGTATEDSECSNNSPLPTEFLEKKDPIPTEFLEKKDPIPTEFLEKKDPFPTKFLEKKDLFSVKFPEKRDPIPTKFLEKRDSIPTKFPEKRDLIPMEFPEKRDPIPTEFSRNGSKGSPGMCRDPGGSAQPAWGSLSLLLLCLVLLVVSGVSILLLILQTARKKPRDGSGRGLQH